MKVWMFLIAVLHFAFTCHAGERGTEKRPCGTCFVFIELSCSQLAGSIRPDVSPPCPQDPCSLNDGCPLASNYVETSIQDPGEWNAGHPSPRFAAAGESGVWLSPEDPIVCTWEIGCDGCELVSGHSTPVCVVATYPKVQIAQGVICGEFDHCTGIGEIE